MEADVSVTDFSELSDADFKRSLRDVTPQLRAFARSLAGDADRADDLVQDTLLKAWAARHSYAEGTHFRAWTFTILRNHFFSGARRNRWIGEWDDMTAERKLAAPASQERTTELKDLMRALQELPPAQREAIILVGAGGMSYEEAAQVTGVAVGTVKSRVARGRDALEKLIASGKLRKSRQQFHCGADPVAEVFATLEGIRQGYALSPRAVSHTSTPLQPTSIAY